LDKLYTISDNIKNRWHQQYWVLLNCCCGAT